MNIYKNILPNGYIAKVPLTFESSLKYQSSEDFFQPCMHLIKELASLEENWDAHNGEAISKTVITNAERLLMNMRSLPAPDIIPSPDSTLSFAWDGENGWAQIDIGNNSFAVYVELNNEVLVKADRLPYNDPAQIEKFAAYIAKIDTQD